MRYNPPWGMTDPEPTFGSEPFINGDPSIGRTGSIPPAAGIEYDQREIVAVIQYASDHALKDQNGTLCAAPTNSDLTQLLKAIYGIASQSGPQHALTASADLYVNPSTGSDTLYDGTAAAVTSGSVHGPYATIQKALNVVGQFAPGTFGATIHLSAGTHDLGTTDIKTAAFAHANVAITGAGITSTAITGHGNALLAVLASGVSYTLSGFSVAYTGSVAGITCIVGNGQTTLNGVQFNGCGGTGGSFASNVVVNDITINGNCGGALFHASGAFGVSFVSAQIKGGGGSWSFGYFVAASMLSSVVVIGTTTYTGAGSLTGARYYSELNAVINTGGGGASYFPGNSPGTATTGLYV